MKNNNSLWDVLIVGAGVIGSAIARELSKYNLKVVIIEKENDVSCGASKANSGIVHGGFDDPHHSVKARFSRAGNRMFQKLNEELNFGYEECGSLVLGFDETDLERLNKLYENGRLNGVDDLRIIEREEILQLEPYINKEVKYALYCPSSGVTSPYEMTIALCENAIANGVTLRLNEEVIGITKEENFIIHTSKETYYARYIVNASGLESANVSKLLGIDEFEIHPRKGEYILLSKAQGHLAKRVLFQTPTNKGKGILVTHTYHGNLLLGPDAREVESITEIGTQIDALKYIVHIARKSIPDFDLKYTLNSFAGLRASSSRHDFIIEESRIQGFIQVAGIESPGLTASPAIAVYVMELLKNSGLELTENSSFDPIRPAIIVKKDEHFRGSTQSLEPDQHIICRCEKVTESEIVDALHRGIPIDHIDGLKRRTRCTMGDCQGNYCSSRVAEIIARERNIPVEDVSVRGKSSFPLPPREDRRFWKKI